MECIRRMKTIPNISMRGRVISWDVPRLAEERIHHLHKKYKYSATTAKTLSIPKIVKAILSATSSLKPIPPAAPHFARRFERRSVPVDCLNM